MRNLVGLAALAIPLALSFAMGCGGKQTRTAAPAASASVEEPVAEAPARPAPTPASPNLAVADDLRKQCSLHFNDRMQAPKFEYDQFQLLPEDREVLDQIATCITRGPLKGSKVALTGRADPRGTEEYNLALGDRRAHTVADYLKRLGVSGSQVATNTRGDLDASGTNENSWRIDRRVDLQLAN